MGQGRLITAYGGQLQRILSRGGTIRFILTDPDGQSMNMLEDRGSSRANVSSIRQSHLAALSRLISLSRISSNKGKVEIKVMDTVMPYTLYGFDLQDSKKGRIFVWLSPFREPSENRPGFMLSHQTSPKWFKFFQEQFHKMWDFEKAKNYEM